MWSLQRKLQIPKQCQKLRKMQCSRVLDLHCLSQKINNASQQIMQIQPIVQTSCLQNCNTFCNWWQFYANGQKPPSYVQLQRRWNANQSFEDRIKNPQAANFLKMFNTEGPKKLGESYDQMYADFQSCFISQKSCERHRSRKVKPVVKKIKISEIRLTPVSYPKVKLPRQPENSKNETTKVNSHLKQDENSDVKKKLEQKLETQSKELKDRKSIDKKEKRTSKKLEEKPDKKINRDSQVSRVKKQPQISGSKNAKQSTQFEFDNDSSLDSLDYKLKIHENIIAGRKLNSKLKMKSTWRRQLPKEPSSTLAVAGNSNLCRKPKRGFNVGRQIYRKRYWKPSGAVNISLKNQCSIYDEHVSTQSKTGIEFRQVRTLYSKPSWISEKPNSSSSPQIYKSPSPCQSTNVKRVSNSVERPKSRVIKKKQLYLARKVQCKSSLRLRQLAIEKMRSLTPKKSMRSPRKGSSSSTVESVKRISRKTTEIPPKNKVSKIKRLSYESTENSISSEFEELTRISKYQIDLVKHINTFLENRDFKYNSPYNGPKNWPVPFESNFLQQWRRDRHPVNTKFEKKSNVHLNNAKKRRKQKAKKKPQQKFEECAICVNIYRREPDKPYMIAMRNHMEREELINYYKCKLIPRPKISTNINEWRNQPRIISLADQANSWHNTSSPREKLLLCYEILCNCHNIVDNELRKHQCTERCMY